MLDTGGLPVGMFADTRYRSETIRVAPRDLGVIVTVGITEAVAVAGVSGIDRLTTALLGAGPALNLPVSPSTSDVTQLLLYLAKLGAS